MLFHFSRFYVITRDTEFRYTMQSSIFPEGVCVRVTERDLVNLCVRLSLHCFVFFPCFSLFMCVCVLIFDRLDNYGVTALQEHRTLKMKHKQPLNGEIHYSMLPTCIGIQAVPVLMHNHVKKKNFLSHIHSTYGHTYSLM